MREVSANIYPFVTVTRRFVDSPRHGVQVEWIPYLDELAQEIGCRVDFWNLFWKDITLWRRLVFGPSLPYQYRLEGRHAWSGAREAILGARERIECPLQVTRSRSPAHVIRNPRYSEHFFLFSFFWGVLGALFMDLILLYS